MAAERCLNQESGGEAADPADIDWHDTAVSLNTEVQKLRAEKDSIHADAKYWRELQEAKTKVAELILEVAEYDHLIIRQGELLTGVADALRGLPPALTTWSHHDLPELAAAAAAEVARLSNTVPNEGSDRG